MIQEQDVKARGESISIGPLGGGGKECALVTCRLLEGPDANLTIVWRGWMNDSAPAKDGRTNIDRTRDALEIFGFDFEDPKSISTNVVSLAIRIEKTPEVKNDDGSVRYAAREEAIARFVNHVDRPGGMKFEKYDGPQLKEALLRLKGSRAPRPGAGSLVRDEEDLF